MTNRLYYDDAYLKRFEARVLKAAPMDADKSIVYLDQSAFYPTSGGQPFDTGTLGGLPVTDVYVDEEGDVAHVVEGTLHPGDSVQGLINWERRFDHMQQHAGEHILAGCVFRQHQGHTNGLHLGHSDSSIDVDFPDGRTQLSDAALYALEDDANAHIQADVPIRCWFPEAEELSRLPLRKPPTVQSHVRVVQIGDDEFCACGGTHPSSAGQIGLIKILDARPSRGKLRLSFVCGRRANLNYRAQLEAVKQLSAILSADIWHLPKAASEALQKLKDAQYHLNAERASHALQKMPAVLAEAPAVNGIKIVCHCFEGVDINALQQCAVLAGKQAKTISLLGSKTESGCLLLFARGGDVQVDVSGILRKSCAQYGGKGGGKSDFARGSAPDERVLETALELTRQEVLRG